MTQWRIYALGASLLVLTSGAYFKGRHDANAACDLRVAAIMESARSQKDAEAESARQASARYEANNAKTRIVYRTITRDVERIVERPLYRNVCLDDDGVRLVNRALAREGAAAGEPDPAMPTTQPAR